MFDYNMYQFYSEKIVNASDDFMVNFYVDKYKEWLFTQDLCYENRISIEEFFKNPPQYNEYFIGTQHYNHWGDYPSGYVCYYLWIHQTVMGWSVVTKYLTDKYWLGKNGKLLKSGGDWKNTDIQFYKNWKSLGNRVIKNVIGTTNAVVVPMINREWLEEKYYGKI